MRNIYAQQSNLRFKRSLYSTVNHTAGCDSTITLELTVNKNSTGALSKTACDTFAIGTNTYTASETYFPVLTNANGCDSLITLNLTIKQSTSLNTLRSACDSYFVNGTTYTSSGLYTIPFINSVGCPSTWHLNLTINSVDTSVTQNGLQLKSNQIGASYQWLDCNNGNAVIAGQSNQTYNAASNGNYAVVVSKNLCSDTSHCYSVVSVDVDENSFAAGITLFPNPANQVVTIHSLLRLNNANLKLLNLEGQILAQEKDFSGADFSFDVSALPQGFYFVELNENGIAQRFKLAKE